MFDQERFKEVEEIMKNEMKDWPKNVGWDVSRSAELALNKCNDLDYISTFFRRCRDTANRLDLALRRIRETILKIDIKEEKNVEDIKLRTHYIKEIEKIVGEGNGETFIVCAANKRWDMIMGYCYSHNMYPREKVGNEYKTLVYRTNRILQQKSIDRAHNQLFNQNARCIQTYLDFDSSMSPSQVYTVLGKIHQQLETNRQDRILLKLHRQ